MHKSRRWRRSATAMAATGGDRTRRRRDGGPGAVRGDRLKPPGGPAHLRHPQYDNTDVYAFVSPDKPDTITFVANWIPFEEPAGGPNFYSFADRRPLRHQHRQRR